ncbi:hypothetical protein V5O48_008583 [Marasmius crinis-equi]|uniref:Uncharacterized protein n=1 Tax=Marasmius crinis-equi TaxID=585013 RepID=A0ABR3FDM1_9AGAR
MVIANPVNQELLALNLKKWSAHPALVKVYSGTPEEDARNWLRHIDRQCDRYAIPTEDRIEAALHFMRGDVQTLFRDSFRQLVEEGEELSWEEFKESLIDLAERVHKPKSESEPSSSSQQTASRKNKLLARMAGGGLIAGGSSVLLPTAGIATLNAVGFTSSGVAAGSLAAGIQSLVYGGATTGLFSVCQSIGATAVLASPVGIVLATGAVAAGAGCFVASKIRENGDGKGQDKEE